MAARADRRNGSSTAIPDPRRCSAEPEWGEDGAPPSWRVLAGTGGGWREWDGRETETQAVRLEADMAPRRGLQLKRWRVE
jgi:hypothetical protein